MRGCAALRDVIKLFGWSKEIAERAVGKLVGLGIFGQDPAPRT